MLNLTDKVVVMVGGGNIASRKILHLLKSGAKVTIISPTITDTLHDLVDEGHVKWIAQPYHFDILQAEKPALVFAATDSDTLNQQIAADSRKIGAWVNVLSDSQLSDFHNMAIVEQTPLTIGISTNGTSPALLKILKARIAAAIGDNIQVLAAWLGEIRPQVQAKIPVQSNRQAFYEQLAQSDILDLLQAGDIEAARVQFDKFIAEGSA